MTKQEFLNKISSIVVKENEKRGNPLFSSVVIAQAINESGWGKSTMMMKANAVFGIKAGISWKGKVYNSKTKECYDGSNFIKITACFRAYNSLEDSVSDYFDLITKNKRYRNACISSTPKECIQAIKNGGYATDPKYVDTIMNIINSNNLTKFDKYDIGYKVGNTYTTLVNLKIRCGAGTNYRQKTYKELTKNAQKYSFKNGILKKGTKVTCQKIETENNNIWIKIPSGYICAYYNGKEYIK